MRRANIQDPDREFIDFHYDEKDPKKFADELNLCNPYSQITCFCLYLYSMEFGDPALYYELNRCCRESDEEHLETLGPVARALSMILVISE